MNPLPEWIDQFLEENPLGAAYLAAINYGCSQAAALALAEEATQQALAEACAHGEFNDYQHFRAWVRRVSYHRVQDELAHQWGQVPLSAEHPVADGNHCLPSAEMHDELAAILGALPDDQRRLLVARFRDGHTFAELAAASDPPTCVATAWHAVNAAVAALGDLLNHHGYDDPEYFRQTFGCVLHQQFPPEDGPQAPPSE